MRNSINFINQIVEGNCKDRLRDLPAKTFHTCVTSPPYWGLRDYGESEQIGQEETLQEYIDNLVEVFREVKRVLQDDGTLWLNLGDCFSNGNKNGLKTKDLVGLPWRVAFALQADGWYLRSDIVWHKPNAMPESVKDRPTRAHEFIFLLTKSEKYYYDYQAIKETAISGDRSSPRGSRGVSNNPLNKGSRKQNDLNKRTYTGFNERYVQTSTTRNKRSVWQVSTKPIKEAHFATFPTDLIEPCIKAGAPRNGCVLDPFFGSGSTGLSALMNGRNFTGIELNKSYIDIAKRRLCNIQIPLDLIGY